MMDGICGFAKKHETVDKQEDNDDKTNSNDTQVTCMTSPLLPTMTDKPFQTCIKKPMTCFKHAF
jgi:hypothetical protein